VQGIAVNKKGASLLSRRQFARRAAMLSASAAIVPGETLLPAPASAVPQNIGKGPQLSPEGQLEADSRYQQILSLYGSRLDDAQKAHIKQMCLDLQPTLEKIRKYNLENGNAPALFLKPLLEREKRTPAAPAAKKA
jgi:hypothetical protein